MKLCPYCAEEIQDAAVKCRFCGEWVEDIEEGTKDKTDAPPYQQIEQSIDGSTESILPDDRPSETGEIENPENIIYSPLVEKPKWGWGWFLFLGLTVPAYQRFPDYNSAISGLTLLAGPFILLFFYFWYRRKLLQKNQYSNKIWHLSFQAGLVTYLLFLIAVPISSYIGDIQQRKNCQNYLTQFEKKAEKINNEKIKLFGKLSISLETEEGFNTYSSTLKEYLEINNKQKEIFKDFFVYMREYGKGRKDEQIINTVDILDSEFLNAVNIAENILNNLLKYNETGNESLYINFENLVPKLYESEKKYKILLDKLIEMLN